MNAATDTTADGALLEQRETLRVQLLLQRQLIAEQLGPSTGINRGYPRSMTMRLLTRHPALIAGALMKITKLLKAK